MGCLQRAPAVVACGGPADPRPADDAHGRAARSTRQDRPNPEILVFVGLASAFAPATSR